MLQEDFFKREVLEVAPDLLGKTLVRRVGSRVTRLVVTEVEAYDGESDKACHASRGRTKRTEVMYGPAGHWYIYLVYGMHHMLNITTGSRGYPSAVLFRSGLDVKGPGRLTRALELDISLNAKKASSANGLWLEGGFEVPFEEIERLPRIGVDYAKEWAEKPYRFVWKSKR
ncbi:MAG: DNA-3-methyladenine glycosylase [Candidatus Paceibacterota bacterium]